MKLKKYLDDAHVVGFKVYGEENTFLGWVYYLKAENGCRYSLSGPIGTHERVKRLVMDYLAEEILLDL